MHKIKRIISSLTLAALIVSCVAGSVQLQYADASKISEAQNEKKALQNKKKELQDTLADLNNDKQDILAYIEKLDGKLNKVSADFEKTEEKIEAKKKSIKKLTKKIKSAEIDINNQYESMKKRIKYMYENGNSDYIDILLDAGSLADMLNKSEYIDKISEYDSNMLDSFVADKKALEDKKASLVDKKKALETIAEELEEEKAALDRLESKKKEEVEKYNASIANAQSEIADTNSELEKQEQIIEAELLRIAQEQMRREEEERKRKKEEERKRQEALKAQQAQQAQQNNTDDSSADNAETDTENDNKTGNSGGFIWPLAVGGKVTSEFGKRNSPTAGASSNHQGIDISAPSGTAIYAAQAGTVVTASYSSGAGNYVMISHGNGVFTVYMHASSLCVSKGDTVKQGQVIAKVGSTGIATGAHLHFGVSVNGTYVNPRNYI